MKLEITTKTIFLPLFYSRRSFTEERVISIRIIDRKLRNGALNDNKNFQIEAGEIFRKVITQIHDIP